MVGLDPEGSRKASIFVAWRKPTRIIIALHVVDPIDDVLIVACFSVLILFLLQYKQGQTGDPGQQRSACNGGSLGDDR